MKEGIHLGARPDDTSGAPWRDSETLMAGPDPDGRAVHTATPAPDPDGRAEVVWLSLRADQLLAQARADARGKATMVVVSSPRQRALLIALTRGSGLGEHASPPAATMHVLRGRFRLFVPQAGHVSDEHQNPQWLIGAGELVAIPPQRHAVDCLEDGVFLLTVTPPG